MSFSSQNLPLLELNNDTPVPTPSLLMIPSHPSDNTDAPESQHRDLHHYLNDTRLDSIIANIHYVLIARSTPKPVRMTLQLRATILALIFEWSS